MYLLAFTGVAIDAGDVQRLAQAHSLDVQTLKVITQSTLLTESGLPGESFDGVVSVSSSSGEHGLGYLTVLSGLIKPGGMIYIQEPGVDLTKLQAQLTLAGFGPAAAGAHGVASAAKPAWQAGARAAISLRRAPGSVSAPAPAPAWKLGLADDDADDLLVDEDALLTEEDLARPAPPTDSGCGPSAKKACKNCTCGRAESEEPVKLTQAMLDRPTSGCGSCALGDAYRCGGCPYRGLPAFEMGKKIELPPDFLVADA